MSALLRTLMVEDSEDDSILIREALKSGGYEVHARRVDTEAELREALHEQPWDIVLSDYCLPSFDARATLEILHEIGRDFPVIVVSGTVGEEVAVETLKLGADDYLLKQNLTRLVPAVKRALSQAESRRQHRKLEHIKEVILENSLDLICSVDAEGYFVEISSAAKSVLGYEPAELLGTPFSRLVPPENLSGIAEEFQAILRGRNRRDLESSLLHKSGHLVHIAWSAVLSRADHVIVGVGRDITERKRMENALREKTALFEAQVESSLDGILVVDRHGRRLIQNHRLDELLKLPPEIAAGQDDAPVLEFVTQHAKDPEAFAAKVAWLYAHPAEVSRDEIEFADGTIFDRYSAPILAQEGHYYGRIWTFRDITERKRMEEALREKTALFEAQVESSPDGILVLDRHGRTKLIQNQRLAELWKIPPDIAASPDAMRQLEWVLTQTRDSSAYASLATRPDTHPEEIIHNEVELVDGTILDRYSAPVLDKEGRSYGRILTYRDITERKRMEDALRENEQRYHDLVQMSPDGIFLNEGGITTFANEAGLKILRARHPQDVIGRTAFELFHPNNHDALRERIGALLHGPGSVSAHEETMLAMDGTEVFVEVTAVSYFVQGRLIIQTICRDITERKQKDEALRREMDERRRVEEILHLAMRVAGMGAWSRDFFAGNAWISPSALALLGQEPSTTGVNIEHLTRIAHPDDRQFVGQVLDHQLDAEHDFDFETRVLRPDGKEGHLHVRSEVFRTPDGAPLQRIGIVEDVTALKRAQIENQALDQRLRQAQKMEAIGTFAAGIAHDFNNMLSVIQTNAELVAFDPTRSSDFARDILHAAGRARELVEQILGFARQQQAPREPMDLRGPVSEAIRLLQGSLTPGITLEQELPQRPATISGNDTQLLRLLLNLGKNAIQAMAGREPARLKIRLETGIVDSLFALSHPPLRTGPAYVLTVSDTGPGMDSATVARIFEPYFSTKGMGGTGLGLALVHGIVAQHEGAILVESKPGLGTTFTVWLPTLPEAADPKTAPPHPAPPKGKRILVVDDEPTIATIAAQFLTKLGYVTETLNDPIAARERIAANPALYDLVITDYRMPGFTGLDLANSVWLARPNLPFILVGGYGPSLETARAAGFATFLAKPFSLQQLSDACTAVFGRR